MKHLLLSFLVCLSLPSFSQTNVTTINGHTFEITSELQENEQASWIKDHIHLVENGIRQELPLYMPCETCILSIQDIGINVHTKELFVIYTNNGRVLKGWFEYLDGWVLIDTTVERLLPEYQLDN